MKAEQIYVQELSTQASFAIRAFDEFSKALEQFDAESVFYHAHHCLIHAANIDKIVSPPKGETYRNAFVSDLVTRSQMDLKSFRRLRNHLEHFDERLELWIRDFSGNAFFDMNLVTGTIGFPQKAFLRAMDGHVLKFQGEEYDLDSLCIEIKKLLTTIEASRTF